MLGISCGQPPRRGVALQLGNGVQPRVSEIAQLLAKNNAAFAKELPSEDQLKALLQHCYNCYDQLDFIYLDYCRLAPTCLLPEQTHKIIRSAKHLLGHLRFWLDDYSLQLLRKSSIVHFAEEPQGKLYCCMCLNRINEMKVKQAKESILGPMHWREIYEDELREEREASRKEDLWQNKEERREYVGSVNFLARIIGEMEESARNYDRLAQGAESEAFGDDHTLFALEELIGKLKYSLGEKQKIKFHSKLKNMLNKIEKNGISKAVHSNAWRAVSQIEITVLPTVTKARHKATPLQDSLISKLKEDNRRLITQNIDLNRKLEALKEKISKGQIGAISRSLSSKNSQHNQQSHNQSEFYPQPSKARNTLGEVSHLSPKQRQKAQDLPKKGITKGKKQNLASKMSGFHLKKFENRGSQLSELLENSIQEENDSEQVDQLQHENEQPAGIIGSKQQNEDKSAILEKRDIACQWEKSIFESLYEARKGSASIASKKQGLVLEVKREADFNLSFQKGRRLQFDSQNNLGPSLNSKKSLVHIGDQPFSKHSGLDHMTLRESKPIDKVKESYKFQTHITEHPTQFMDSTNFQHNPQEKMQKTSHNKSFKNLKIFNKNKTSNQKSRISNQKRLGRANLGSQLKSGKLELEKKKDLTLDNIRFQSLKDETMPQFKQRVITEQSAYTKKAKKIRNIIFQPEHLTLFGGVSQSYAYQNWKTELNLQSLSEKEQSELKGLKFFIENLKSFKSGLYENILCFLGNPYEMIEKNQIQYKPCKSEVISKVLLKLLLFHKKKCGSAGCQHLLRFYKAIGYFKQQ